MWTGCWRKWILLAWQNVRKAVAVRDQFARRTFGKHRTCGGAHLQSWKCSARLQKSVRYEIGRQMDISRSSVWRIAKHDLRLKIYNRMSGLLSFDRWRHFIFQSCCQQISDDVKNEITLIYAKFGADLVNNCKVFRKELKKYRKARWPRFWATL